MFLQLALAESSGAEAGEVATNAIPGFSKRFRGRALPCASQTQLKHPR